MYLAQSNLKIIKKSAWITVVSFFALIAIIYSFELSKPAIYLGAVIGLILGVISPFFWQKNYQALNALLPSFLLTIPGSYLANSSGTVNVTFQFLCMAVGSASCYWFVLKSTLIRYLESAYNKNFKADAQKNARPLN